MLFARYNNTEMRTRIFRFILSLAAAVVSLSACGQGQGMPQDGDIVFHESASRQSPVIKLAQHSRWTHCGIVFHIGEKAYVYEAVEPVKYTPLKDWIARGKNGEYRVKRLKKPLPAEAVAKMKAVGGRYKGKHYDTLFQWSDNKMYCSVHDYWKTTALIRWTFVGKVMSLLFNTLARFVIAFLPRSKRLSIS